MRKILTIAATLAALSAGPAFASEGTYQPAAVASPAAGAVGSARSVGDSFMFTVASGNYGDMAMPARGGRAFDRKAWQATSYAFNMGLQG